MSLGVILVVLLIVIVATCIVEAIQDQARADRDWCRNLDQHYASGLIGGMAYMRYLMECRREGKR